MTDDELFAQIKAAQTVAVSKLQERWGMTADQMAKANATLAAPEPTTITTKDLEAAWARSAGDQFRSLGIEPVSDEEAARIQAAMDAAVAKRQAEQASDLDDQLHDFRLAVQHDRAAKSGLYYHEDASKMREIDRLVRETESNMILARLEAGLPAEPPPRKSPAEIAQERFTARRAAQS